MSGNELIDQESQDGPVLQPLAGRGAGINAEELLARLYELRQQRQSDDFWLQFCLTVAALCRARGAIAAEQSGDDDEAAESWRFLGGQCPPEALLAQRWRATLQDLASRTLAAGFAMSPQAGAALVAVRLTGVSNPTILLLEIPDRERSQLNELILRARLVADLPAGGDVAGEASGGGAGVSSGGLLELLDLLVQVMRERHFGAAALTLVNGLSAHLGCNQVTLGWIDRGYVRSQAISHLDRFERKTENVQLLEAAFEEAVDQETDIHYPADEGSGCVVMAHARFCRVLGYESATSMTLRRGEQAPEAVVLMAGIEGEISDQALAPVSFALHLVLPWLADLRKRDRWIGARFGHWVADTAGQWIGLEHVGRKLVAIVLGALLLYVLLGTWEHRIEANAELTTDSTRLLSAPFDGFFDEVAFTAGDEVDVGDVLGSFDIQDLQLQESEVRADIRRFEAEADRARAMGQMADVEIARARGAQAGARLDRVLYLLDQARITAPFGGVVVEGERRDLLGTPVRQGDPLFRLARIEGLYAILYVPERDIRFVEPGASGELRLLSQPNESIPFELETLIPVAQVRGQQGNHFMLKVRLEQEPEAWWRPGMAGSARIDAGRANIAWLLTHRLIDSIRLWLWW